MVEPLRNEHTKIIIVFVERLSSLLRFRMFVFVSVHHELHIHYKYLHGVNLSFIAIFEVLVLIIKAYLPYHSFSWFD